MRKEAKHVKISHDGQVEVGSPAPSWTQNPTKSSMNYGLKETPPWEKEENDHWSQVEHTLKEIVASRKTQLTQDGLKRIKEEHLQKKRISTKRSTYSRPGPKNKLNDEQALDVRRNAKTKSYAALARQYGVHRHTIEKCVKGITFKHLDFLCPPQL